MMSSPFFSGGWPLGYGPAVGVAPGRKSLRRAEHAARLGFLITELQLSPTQKVPWHTHTNVSDTFYVLEGQMRLFLQEPKEEVKLKPGEVYVVRPTRPHLVTNGGTTSLTFLVLQGVGEYDFVPLASRQDDPS
jgi:mannose-6-phosphate isomerase-like protein (cupin superfamily)